MTTHGPRIGGVGIAVADLARSTSFYEEVFGLAKLMDLELETMNETILVAEASPIVLILMCHTDGIHRDPANTGGKIVFNVADPGATAEAAAAHGGAITSTPEPAAGLGGKLIAFITDPDGQVIELIEA